MANLLTPTNETGITYTLVAANGARAVFNDATDPDYIGPLAGDDGITGLDSAEIIESYSQRTEDDGAMHGNFFFGRRPITMNGVIVPTSQLDRATRLDKLKRVLSNAMRSNATLYFTPTGGEPVFINLRAQQPPRFKGRWAKDFFVGLVADDPRIYSIKQSTSFHENPNLDGPAFRRFTWASGSGTALASRTLNLPPGTWRFKQYVRRSTAAGTLALAITPNSALVSTPAALTTGWTEITQVVTTTALESASTTVQLNLSAALTTGQYVDVGPLVVESDSGVRPSDTAGFAANWTAGAGYTASFNQTAPLPPGIENQGNSPSAPRTRIIGPITNVIYLYASDGRIQPGASGAYILTDYLVTDVYNRTGLKKGSTNYYSTFNNNTSWTGVQPGFFLPYYSFVVAGGATTGTRFDISWRNAYI